MNKVQQLFSNFVAWMDSFGRYSWIVLMVIGFIISWPIGLIILFFMLWTKRFGGDLEFKEKIQDTVNKEKVDTIRKKAFEKYEIQKKRFEGFFSKDKKSKDTT